MLTNCFDSKIILLFFELHECITSSAGYLLTALAAQYEAALICKDMQPVENSLTNASGVACCWAVSIDPTR